MRATLPRYTKLNQRAAVHGLIEFDHGRWINDPDFQQHAMTDLGTSRPQVRFLLLKRWLERVGVLEDLDLDHGRDAVQFLRFVLDMTIPGGALDHLFTTVDDDGGALMVQMLSIALDREAQTTDSVRTHYRATS